MVENHINELNELINHNETVTINYEIESYLTALEILEQHNNEI